ncbi:MAG: 23S rRNA methyltransferase [Candidatus Peregrinibacteria bacterium GW2011_GWF2_39_17]|nr:MAG: 23S rRNA methyltransferase [Candidatus Peregrinibacteria bacterium GW2011_GWF2_39_17]
MPKPFTTKDQYFYLAKAKNLRARSAFKLEEIQKKFSLIKNGAIIADLGAAPGSWSQLLSQWIGQKGKIFAIDLQEIEPIASNVQIFCGDITDFKFLNKIFEQKITGAVADLAPKTTGTPDADSYHSAELNHAVLDICQKYLHPNGFLITKIFQGEEFVKVNC